MKLIGSLTSPYVRKVRVVLAEKKLDYQLILENVWSPDTLIQRYNPLGKVPCLIMDEAALLEGSVLEGALFDSRVIVEYLDTLSPVSRLLPQAGRERATVKCWEALADGVLDAAVTVFKERQRPADQISTEWTDRQLRKIHAALQTMSHELGENSFCIGINYTLADIAVGCALDYLAFRFPEVEWRTTYPRLEHLHTKLMARASFKSSSPAVSA